MPAQTAYWGILDVANIKAGETVVVSGAAGAVGTVVRFSLRNAPLVHTRPPPPLPHFSPRYSTINPSPPSQVCQIAKLKGCRVIALAGGPEKCKFLVDELGVDAALDYKSKTFRDDFKKTVGYLDVYFDNVGGEILDLCLTRLKKNARIASTSLPLLSHSRLADLVCAQFAEPSRSFPPFLLSLTALTLERNRAYNDPNPKGLQMYLNLISQRAKIEGFIVFDYADRYHIAEGTFPPSLLARNIADSPAQPTSLNGSNRAR